MTREEQETFFRNSAVPGEEWDFYSRDPAFKRLLERRGYTVVKDHQGLWSCKLPRKALTVRSAGTKRQVSPEQRKAAAERFQKGRSFVRTPLADKDLTILDAVDGPNIDPIEGDNKQCE
jgi:hypothetical protein